MRAEIQNDGIVLFQGLVKRASDIAPVMKVWGKMTERETKRSAKAKGGKRFWREVADAVHLEAITSTGFIVNISHVAARQKEFGGIIRPVKAKALAFAVPKARAEVNGMRPGEYAQRMGKALFRPKGTRILAVSDPAASRGFRPIFVLSSKAEQDPDPFLPTPEWLGETGVEIAGKFIDEGRL